jgi:hypothetical protein
MSKKIFSKEYFRLKARTPAYKAKRLAYAKSVKDLVFNHYGGYKCSCCGETEENFLSIDHINGGGNDQRKILGAGGYALYRWIINNDFPEGFRVLCMNCNWAKGIFGTCPHQKQDYMDRIGW